ncbi:RNA polymerase II transcription elongation factor-domain-containing protein [Podospora aff. communis PSN243]|uniref:RNA polymerase II transcription elongation factor-domain-containing protein n=1 Tax=Podospora aff. communis PSN243 TaxID=3040156 RepID=A0AAV9GY83_9PEZI|nr:RNA polymerase II transcription elongation factor-domain-containing protein [Podospora aff. communis PSN243]
MAAPGSIDPTKPAKYPIILSDALLGKTSKETYTGVRYNHRPTLSSDAAPSISRLKKSAKDGSYNLGFDDNGDKYQYNGVRTSEDGNYVLIFDPSRKAFVLHRVDSMFHMNLTKTPTDSVESLRKKFPHLEVKAGSSSKQQSKGKKDTAAGAEKVKPPAPAKGKGKEKAAPKKPAAKKAEKAAPKPMELTLPTAAPTPPAPRRDPSPPPPQSVEEEKKPKRRARSPVESEEDDDDDGGLILEFPDGNPTSSFSSFPPTNNFSPAFPPFPATRRFSEFVSRQDEEDDDIDAEGDDEMIEEEEEEEEMEDVKLGSPINRTLITEPERFEFETSADAEGDEFDGDDLEADLEAELEKELMMVENQQAQDSDSSMSEEE